MPYAAIARPIIGMIAGKALSGGGDKKSEGGEAAAAPAAAVPAHPGITPSVGSHAALNPMQFQPSPPLGTLAGYGVDHMPVAPPHPY